MKHLKRFTCMAMAAAMALSLAACGGTPSDAGLKLAAAIRRPS